MKEVEIPSSFQCRRTFPGFISLTLLLIVVSVILLWLGFRSVKPWGMVLLGGVIMALWIRLSRRNPVLKLDERGIEDRRTTRGLIPWDEIRQVNIVDRGEYPTLEIETQGAGGGPAAEREAIVVKLVDLLPGVSELWTFVHERHHEKIPPSRADELEMWTWSTEGMTVEQGWNLLDWCLARGADEFKIDSMANQSTPRKHLFFERLQPYARPAAWRSSMGRHREAEAVLLWRLDEDTIRILRESLAKGILSHKRDGDLWLEDPVIYREGRALFEVISHEEEAYMTVYPAEFAELRPMLPRAIRLPWIYR